MKIFLDVIGCRLNQSEIERMAAQFRAAGHEIVASAEMAEVVVVNTCAVTGNAVADSRKKIRQALRGGAQQVLATGCWATLAPEDTAALADAVRVVNNEEKEHLVADFLRLPVEDFATGMIARHPLPGAHSRTRAFIKVQMVVTITALFVLRAWQGAPAAVCRLKKCWLISVRRRPGARRKWC